MRKESFKQVMLQYDTDQQNAEKLKNSRTQEVYIQIPKIKEIDEEIKELSFKALNSILYKHINTEELAAKLHSKISQLETEKKLLLKSHNYDENYLLNVYKCNLCKDTGYIYIDDIKKEHCPCLTQRLINSYYNLSNLVHTLEIENFDNFDLRLYSEEVDSSIGISPLENIRNIYEVSSRFASKFTTEFTNLLFYGNAGLGKTFLCNCIAKDILGKGIPVLYITASQLFKTIEQARFNRDEMDNPLEQVNMFYTIDLLIIDDLGTEVSTSVTNSELFSIINDRILNKKHTIISTNLSPKDIASQYSDRIISRFNGSYKLLRFIGEDIRSKKKYMFKNP